jgi:amino acid adenylation domain-containing protein/non-ribosomal peptide synthase protein (TIGR01720 family)
MSNKNIILTGSQFSQHKEFWFAQSTLSDLEFRFAGNKGQFSEKCTVGCDFPLNEASLHALQKITRGKDLEMFIVLVAGWQVLLSRYSRQDYIVIHTPLLKDIPLEVVFEPCVAVAGIVDRHCIVKEFIAATNSIVTATYKFQSYPLSNIGDNNGSRLATNVLITFDAIHKPLANAEDYDLVIEISKCNEAGADGLALKLFYNSSLYDEWYIQGVITHYNNILSGFTAYNKPVFEMSMLGPDECKKILHGFNNNTVSFPVHQTVTELFEAQAAIRPDALAVVTGENYLTYDQLNQKANQVGCLLRETYNVKTGDIVGIMLDRSEWMIVAIVGVLKAGAAYLPLDPGYPKERISYMLSNAQVKTLIVQAENMLMTEWPNDLQLLVTDLHPEIDEPFEGNIPGENNSSDCAYVIYTSGSTGYPKAVPVSHKALLNTEFWRKDFYGFDHSFSTLQFASFSFDSSVNDIFSMLLWGGKLVILNTNERSDVIKIRQLLKKHKITNFNVVPSFYKTLIKELGNDAYNLRVLTLAGEKLSQDLIKTHFSVFPDVRIINEYGPTENAICSTACIVTASQTMDTLIGKPVSNTQVYVLNSDMEIMPVGAAGEICLSGMGLTDGYLYNDALNEERFVKHPFRQDGKMYRTGDVGRWLPDGQLEFLGRQDDQVKIRGYRVEPGEIEKLLLFYPAVDNAVVIAHSRHDGSIVLAAYLTGIEEADFPALQQYVKHRLPDYMVPSYFIPVSSIPLTPNNKIDRSALRLRENVNDAGELNYKAPQTPIEKLLAAIWEEVLGKRRVSITDDFFACGGDSIKAIQIAARMYKAGYQLEIRQLFEYPVIADLALMITPVSRIPYQDLVTGKVPLTPIQQEIFLKPRISPHHYNQSLMLGFEDKVSREVIEAIFRKIQEHHDALRMTFTLNGSDIIQYNHGLEYPFDLKEWELTGAEGEVERICNSIQEGIVLEKGPLMRLGLLQAAGQSLLFIAIHHLVIDAVSWRILFEDIETLYHKISKGEPLMLPLKTDSFKLWSEKLLEYASSDKLLAEKEYWVKTEVESIKPLPRDFDNDSNFIRDSVQITCALSKQDTEALLTKVNAAFNTEINDILLSALGICFSHFTGQNKIVINLEGHGRERILDDIEISRTVGWFTSSYPVVISNSDHPDLADQIIEVKESLRRIPNKGVGYGILKYLSGDNAGLSVQPEISFNYLGQFEAGASNNVFDIVAGEAGYNICIDEQRQFIIEVSGGIADNVLVISFAYNKQHYKAETIQRLGDSFRDTLIKIIHFCASSEKRLTPGDLTYAQVPADALTVIRRNYDFIDIYQLSPMQEGLLFHHLLNRSSNAYFEQVSYRLHGHLAPALVEKSINELFKRHDILRTAFVIDIVDRPLQVLLKERKASFTFCDISSMDQNEKEVYVQTFKEQDIQRGFDLANDPLLRVSLLQIGPAEFEFVFSHHHIVMDGWCIGVLISEYFIIYKSIEEERPYILPPVKQYKNYISWLAKLDGQLSAAFWQKYLLEYDEIATVKNSHIAPDGQYQGKQVLLQIGKGRMRKLNELAVSQRVTINTIVQTLWGILLAKYNGRTDVVFGSVVSGRPAGIEGIESMIGLFINTIPVRVSYTHDTTLSGLLHLIQQDGLKSEPHHHYPLAEIQAGSELNQGLFDHIIIFENFPVQIQIEGSIDQGHEEDIETQVSNVSIFEQTNYDLNIMVSPGEEFRIVFNFNQRVFKTAFIEELLFYLSHLIDETLAVPDVLVKDMNLLPANALSKRIALFNDTSKSYRSHSLVHELFEEQAASDPFATAILYEKNKISFGSLNDAANRLAYYLINDLRVQPGDLVGLMCDRSPWLLITMLAIMKSGAAYLPLDPSFPHERLQYIAEDSGIQVLLRHSKYVDINISVANTIDFDRLNLTVPVNTGNPSSRINSQERMYMIYTSGSTGKPKGVSIAHRSVVNLLTDISNSLEVRSIDKLLAVTTYSFDISVLELFVPLIMGSQLLLTDQSVINDAFALQELINRENPTIMQATPSLWSMLINAGWSGDSCMKMLCGGERLTEELGIKLLQRSAVLYNMYGPTETTIWSTCKRISGKEDLNTIGRPLSNTQIYIVDNGMRLLPPGIKGELFIGGDGIAMGYHNRESLNNQRFIKDPFEGNGLLYKTGDIARWLPNGDIEFLGRVDDQVKIRGYRVEPGEAEDALMKHPMINEAVVVIRNIGGDDQLVGYYKSEAFLSAEVLRTWLMAPLPEYMIPAFFIPLTEFPQTPNGKVDRKALPLPLEEITYTLAESDAAEPLREKLLAIWQHVLGTKAVSPDNNFFVLGGHSLKATRLMSAIYKELNVRPEIRTIFSHPVFNDFYQVVSRLKRRNDVLPIPAIEMSDNYVVSPVQEQMWLIDGYGASREAYTITAAFNVDGNLHVAALFKALETLQERHEILRTVFVTINGEPRQKVLPFEKSAHCYVDIREEENIPQINTELANEEANVSIDLGKGPLFRPKLVRIEEEKYVLFLTMHHIITDDWSMEIMMNELSVLYEAFSNHKESPLVPLRLQYKDYAAWQKKILFDNYHNHLRFWLNVFDNMPASLNLRSDAASVVNTSGAEEILFSFDKQIKDTLEAVSIKNGATIYMTLLALLNTLLTAFTGQTDIVIGSPFAGREHPDLEDQLGPYLNTLALRTNFSMFNTLDELIKKVKDNWLKAIDHGMFPIDKLINELRISGKMQGASLYDVGFTWHNTTGMSKVKASGATKITISPFVSNIQRVKTDFWFHAHEADSEIQFSFLYNKDMYSHSSMSSLIHDFKLLIGNVKHDQIQSVQELIEAVKNTNRKTVFMEQQSKKNRNLKKFFGTPGKKDQPANRSLVREHFLQGQGYPLVIQSQFHGLVLNEWIKTNIEELKRKLIGNGALLLRGFHVNTLEEFREGAIAFSDNLMKYIDQSSPRSLVGEKLYTSTDHPADQVIPMHSELSYSRSWPLQIMFHCVQPAETGGETPICDTRSILKGLSAKTLKGFAERGILYVRNIVEGFGLRWQDVYQTEDKHVVEEYCNRHDIRFKWISDKHLNISWSGTAISEHPVTGEKVWFNHGLFFNEHILPHAVREVIGNADYLPFNTFYGDGKPIPADVIREIKQAFESAKVTFAWEKGDVLLLDNMLMTHGRHPFTGNRKVVVAMTNPYSGKPANTTFSSVK